MDTVRMVEGGGGEEKRVGAECWAE